jgi:anti-anti-sigma factor
MHIEFERDQEISDGVVVRLDGALEIAGSDRLWALASERVSSDTRFFLFDLTNVTIITSAAIGTLVRLLIRLRGVGGSLAIFGCSDKICDVFDIVMLRQILQVSDSEEDARSRLRAKR